MSHRRNGLRTQVTGVKEGPLELSGEEGDGVMCGGEAEGRGRRGKRCCLSQ